MNGCAYIARRIRWETLLFIVNALFFCAVAAARPAPLNAANGEAPHTPSKGKRLRADSLMEAVFTYTRRTQMEEVQYICNVYLRHRMYTKRKGPIVGLLPHMMRLERGANDYITEAQLRFQFRPPGEVDCKLVAFHTTARNLPLDRMSSISRLSFLLYEPTLFNNLILNPLNRRNRRFYRYTFLHTFMTEGHPTARIRITPRFSNDQLTNGYIDIDLRTGAVCNFLFSVRIQLQHFTISGQPGTQGYATLIPEHMRIVSDLRLMGNRVHEEFNIISSNTFSCITQPSSKARSRQAALDLTQQLNVRIDTTRIITSPSYFDKIRPIPLRHGDKKLYGIPDDPPGSSVPGLRLPVPATDSTCTDTTEAATEVQPDSTDNHRKTLKALESLLRTHAFKLDGDGRSKVVIPPLITPSFLQWSKTRGFSLQTRIRLNLYLPKADGEFDFFPRIGYSFKQKQIYWNLPLQLPFCPHLDGFYTFEAGGGSHQYSSSQADAVREQLRGITAFDSLNAVLNSYEFHYYRDAFIKSDVTIRPLPGLHLTAGLRYHRRTLIRYTPLAAQTGMNRTLNSIGPRLQIELTPRQYYYRQGKRRIALYSQYPTFLLSYERGYSVGKAPTAYERIEGDIRYRLPLYAMRTFFFRAGAGYFIQRSRDCFLDYDYFRFSSMPAGWDDDMTGTFQLLDSRWYNESSHYLRLTATYESPMLFLSRIPGFSRMVQSERLYCNLLNVRHLPFYSEWGYAFSTHFCDLGAFLGASTGHSLQYGVKFSLRFFDN